MTRSAVSCLACGDGPCPGGVGACPVGAGPSHGGACGTRPSSVPRILRWAALAAATCTLAGCASGTVTVSGGIGVGYGYGYSGWTSDPWAGRPPGAVGMPIRPLPAPAPRPMPRPMPVPR